MPRKSANSEVKRPKKRLDRRVIRFLCGLFATPQPPPEVSAGCLGSGSCAGCSASSAVDEADDPRPIVGRTRNLLQRIDESRRQQPPGDARLITQCDVHVEEASTSLSAADRQQQQPSPPPPPDYWDECTVVNQRSSASTPRPEPEQPDCDDNHNDDDDNDGNSAAFSEADCAPQLPTPETLPISPTPFVSLERVDWLCSPAKQDEDVGNDAVWPGLRHQRRLLISAPLSLRKVVTQSCRTDGVAEEAAAMVTSPEAQFVRDRRSSSTLSSRSRRTINLPKVQWLFQVPQLATSLPPQPTTRTATVDLVEPLLVGERNCRLLQLHRHQSAVASLTSLRPSPTSTLTARLTEAKPPQPPPRPPPPQLQRLLSLSVKLQPKPVTLRMLHRSPTESPDAQDHSHSSATTVGATTDTGRYSESRHVAGIVAETVRRINAIPAASSASDQAEFTPTSSSNTLDLARRRQQFEKLQQIAKQSVLHRANVIAMSRAPNASSKSKVKLTKTESSDSEPVKPVKPVNSSSSSKVTIPNDYCSKPQVSFSELLARFETVDRRRKKRPAPKPPSSGNEDETEASGVSATVHTAQPEPPSEAANARPRQDRVADSIQPVMVNNRRLFSVNCIIVCSFLAVVTLIAALLLGRDAIIRFRLSSV